VSEKRERQERRQVRDEADEAERLTGGGRHALPIRYTLGVGPRPVSWSDLFGIDPDFTGDLTTDEYLDASRGEA